MLRVEQDSRRLVVDESTYLGCAGPRMCQTHVAGASKARLKYSRRTAGSTGRGLTGLAVPLRKDWTLHHLVPRWAEERERATRLGRRLGTDRGDSTPIRSVYRTNAFQAQDDRRAHAGGARALIPANARQAACARTESANASTNALPRRLRAGGLREPSRHPSGARHTCRTRCPIR
jgi:hypothetical protein